MLWHICKRQCLYNRIIKSILYDFDNKQIMFSLCFSVSPTPAAAAGTPSRSRTPTRANSTTRGRPSGMPPTPSSTGRARPEFLPGDPQLKWFPLPAGPRALLPTWPREAADLPTTMISDWKCNFLSSGKCWGPSRDIHSEKKVFTSNEKINKNRNRTKSEKSIELVDPSFLAQPSPETKNLWKLIET